MSSREFDEGDVMLGEEEGRGGNCSGELLRFSGRAGSVGRERRLYRPADIDENGTFKNFKCRTAMKNEEIRANLQSGQFASIRQ